MILKKFHAVQIAAMQRFVDLDGLGPPRADGKMNRLGHRENPYLAQFHTKGRLVPQTALYLAADLIEGNLESAGREKSQVAARRTSRLDFLAEAFDETSQGLRNVRHQREGINRGSSPAKPIHCCLPIVTRVVRAIGGRVTAHHWMY
jgi:hypothetical protein